MSSAESRDDDRGPSARGGGATRRLVARVVHYETGDELTLFPPDASGCDLMACWLTAGEGSWVTLDEMR